MALGVRAAFDDTTKPLVEFQLCPAADVDD
jgi:hypothetical protein